MVEIRGLQADMDDESYYIGYQDALTEVEGLIKENMEWFHLNTTSFMAENLTKQIQILRQASFGRRARTE